MMKMSALRACLNGEALVRLFDLVRGGHALHAQRAVVVLGGVAPVAHAARLVVASARLGGAPARARLLLALRARLVRRALAPRALSLLRQLQRPASTRARASEHANGCVTKDCLIFDARSSALLLGTHALRLAAKALERRTVRDLWRHRRARSVSAGGAWRARDTHACKRKTLPRETRGLRFRHDA
jgi:hypothetical protein